MLNDVNDNMKSRSNRMNQIWYLLQEYDYFYLKKDDCR